MRQHLETLLGWATAVLGCLGAIIAAYSLVAWIGSLLRD